MSDPFSLRARDVTFAYTGTPVVRNASLDVRAGEAVALVGPNGSGKTTLLRLLAGDLEPDAGEISIDGQPVRGLKPAHRARRIAVVPQHVDPGLAFPVEVLVSMGRAPYLGLLGSLSPTDRAAINTAIDSTDTSHLARRPFRDLSGGEQQRVALAMALAQETPFLLLDEPTVHLDLGHQSETLELLRRLQRERDIGLIAVMHDLNLAALYFDRIAVMCRGQMIADADPESILTRTDLLDVFQAPLTTVTHPEAGIPQVLLRRRE